MLVKRWAQAEDLCGAAGGNLSSYAFLLMAIFFLQVDSEVCMPCLPTSCFHGEDNIPDEAVTSWQCPLPVAVLLTRFFDFFAWEFEWGQEVVSVRWGQRFNTSHVDFGQLRGRLELRLHIEDPFLPARNLHCVLNASRENELYSKLCEASQDMQSGRLPRGLQHCVASANQAFLLRGRGGAAGGRAAGATVSAAAIEHARCSNGATIKGADIWQPQHLDAKNVADRQQLVDDRQPAAVVQTDLLARQEKVLKYEPAPEEVPPTTLCRKLDACG